MADFQSQQYQKQYQYLLDQLQDAFDKKYGIDKIEGLINEAKEIQDQCKMINYKLPATMKQSFLSFESRYQEMTRKQTRTALLGNPIEDESTALLGTTDNGNQKLQGAHAIALETEQVGIQTLQELKRQREQLQHTQQTLRTADRFVDRATSRVRQMTQRMMLNKVVSLGIVIVLVILIVLVLLLKLI